MKLRLERSKLILYKCTGMHESVPFMAPYSNPLISDESWTEMGDVKIYSYIFTTFLTEVNIN
jgi:hypothetical protein